MFSERRYISFLLILPLVLLCSCSSNSKLEARRGEDTTDLTGDGDNNGRGATPVNITLQNESGNETSQITVNPGENVTIRWNAPGVGIICTLRRNDGTNSDDIPLFSQQNSYEERNVTTTVEFTLVCSDGSGASSSATLRIDVDKPNRHTVFVTSDDRSGSEIGGLTGADTWCTQRAQASTLDIPKNRPWKAILSDENTNAIDRLQFFGPVYNTNNDLIRDIPTSGGNLFSSNGIENDIKFNENGVRATNSGNINLWTGTLNSGQKDAGHTCSSWTSESGDARSAHANFNNGEWIQQDRNGCNNEYRIYCVSQ